MADCIGFPQFSCALLQMRYSIGENGRGHILKGGGGGGEKSDRKGKRDEKKKGERGWGSVRDNSRTSGTTKKKQILKKFSFHGKIHVQ